MRIPNTLARLRSSEGGRAWLRSLPALLDACTEQWNLTVGDPYEGGFASYAAPATGADGSEAVLKIQYPHRESDAEADALRAWAGHGAVRLLASDPDGHALLIERCVPGSSLSAAGPTVALDVIIGLVRELSISPPSGVGSLEDEAQRWSDAIPASWDELGRPFERRLVDAALDAIDALTTTQREKVLLHQDLHGDNVLAAQRRPWLAIDPKPLAGERAFQAAPVVRSAELGTAESDVLYRLERLCDELDLEPDRARGWTLAQTLAWSFEVDGVLDWHLEVARLMAE